MDAVLNEVTNTVHKHAMGRSDLQSACGATANLDHDDLRITTIEPEISPSDATKCGRCFDDGGGY